MSADLLASAHKIGRPTDTLAYKKHTQTDRHTDTQAHKYAYTHML